MLTELMMARAALSHMELDIDRHAELQCTWGNWRNQVSAASEWVREHFAAAHGRS